MGAIVGGGSSSSSSSSSSGVTGGSRDNWWLPSDEISAPIISTGPSARAGYDDSASVGSSSCGDSIGRLSVDTSVMLKGPGYSSGQKRPASISPKPVSNDGGEEQEVVVHKKKRKRVPMIQRSLAIVLQSLIGNQIVVECKHGTEVSGIILEVSEAGLGMLLGAARVVNMAGEVNQHREYYLIGSAIRYVHLPPSINAAKHLNKFIFDKEATLDLSHRPHLLIDKEKLRPSKSPCAT
jgi:small nuclear ribonucleoprotein (snRNP)-like protein